MDDEDRSEFGIAPGNMQTSQEFSGQKRARPQGFHDGPIPGETAAGVVFGNHFRKHVISYAVSHTDVMTKRRGVIINLHTQYSSEPSH